MNTFTPMEKIYIVRTVLVEKLALLDCIDPLSKSDAMDLALQAHNQFLTDVEIILEEHSR
jgi:hypothetical protein